jgi:hypothetical protein
MSMTYDELKEAFRSCRKSDAELRSFACDCCEQLYADLDDSLLRRAVEFGRRRIRGEATDAEIVAMKQELQARGRILYPGYDDASPSALALFAVSELVCDAEALNAAVGASDFVAQAISKLAAENGDEAEYDHLMDSVYDRLLASHLEMLRSLELPT